MSRQPLLSDLGTPVGVRMSMRDIDDRKSMEHQLRAYATQLEQFSETRTQQILTLESEK